MNTKGHHAARLAARRDEIEAEREAMKERLKDGGTNWAEAHSSSWAAAAGSYLACAIKLAHELDEATGYTDATYGRVIELDADGKTFAVHFDLDSDYCPVIERVWFGGVDISRLPFVDTDFFVEEVAKWLDEEERIHSESRAQERAEILEEA